MIIEASAVLPCFPGSYNVVFEPKSRTLPGGLIVEPTIVTVDQARQESQTIPVLVQNPTDTPLWVPRHAKFGEIVLGEEVGTANSGSQHVSQENGSNSDIVNNNVDFVDSTAPEEAKERVRKIVENYAHAFRSSDIDIGHSTIVEHRIPVTDPHPVRERYRKIPPGQYEEVRKHLKEMHDAGVIRESFSPYASPVVLVRKKDESLRLCIDFRKLNQKTVRDSYALPRIDEILQIMKGSCWFSSLDLKAEYWQIEVSECDKAKTAFVLPPPFGLWECNRMPFGLCNAPSTFQRAMEKCLGELNHVCCVGYLDDIIVFGRSLDEHIERLEKVIDWLASHGFKMKQSKCCLLQPKVQYLGHVLSENGISTDPSKVETIDKGPTSRNVKELRAFLGLASYYRKFIEKFARIAQPLYEGAEVADVGEGAEAEGEEVLTVGGYSSLKEREVTF